MTEKKLDLSLKERFEEFLKDFKSFAQRAKAFGFYGVNLQPIDPNTIYLQTTKKCLQPKCLNLIKEMGESSRICDGSTYIKINGVEILLYETREKDKAQ